MLDMSMEGFVGILALLAIGALIFLRVPPKVVVPPPPNEIKCPKCKATNLRSCPNCGSVIPWSAELKCPACHVTATALPCRVCKTDLKAMPQPKPAT